ncbi:hypothetical protein [Lysinibacillus sp. NPDC047702]|uniref:hypothetical protein n=1 Tax=unclassified Lysinibacillus TaxID=2636778 RepID=UPI003D08A12E
MKNKFTAKFTALTALSIVLFLGIDSASAKEQEQKEPKILKTEYFTEFYGMSDDVLIDKALKGENVDTPHKKVKIKENDEKNEISIEIDKALSETTFDDGTVVEDRMKSVSTFVSVEGPYPNSKTSEALTASSSAKVLMSISYQSITVGTLTGYKLSSYSVTPILQDNAFTLTKFQYEARSNGSGYKLDGKSYNTLETTGVQTISNPVSGTPFSKTLSWVKYNIETGDGFGSGVTGDLWYARSGTTYRLPFLITAN